MAIPQTLAVVINASNTHAHPEFGILRSHKKVNLAICNNMEDIIIRKISKTQKETYCMILPICVI